jgi:aryl-alcohol dehydrogenase-like predicted oxidoreductase
LKTRRLGVNGPQVSELGLGCMGMSDFYGPADEAESLATLDAAIEAGVTLLDTGDFYGVGHNEMLVGRAIRGRRDKLRIVVKFGAMRDPSGGFIGYDARPAAVKNFLAYTLKRLGTDYLDVYQPARLDPNVPIEDTVGAMAEMVKAGYVRHLGLSEMGAATIRKAHAVHPVAELQIEYSLMSRSVEREVLPTCRELGIAITAYGVLSRGLLSGSITRENMANRRDFRAISPRFQGENLTKNLQLVDALAKVARELGATPAQAAIAWVLSRGEDIIPLVGARRRDRLAESLKAVELKLTPEQLRALERAVPAEVVAGERYDSHSMAMLDSERPSQTR